MPITIEIVKIIITKGVVKFLGRKKLTPTPEKMNKKHEKIIENTKNLFLNFIKKMLIKERINK